MQRKVSLFAKNNKKKGVFQRPLVGLKTPRAAMAIPGCGDGHFRVRRWASPHAAFFYSITSFVPPVVWKKVTCVFVFLSKSVLESISTTPN